MGIRKYNPTTPGLRGMTVSTFEEITTSTPEKSLTVTLKKHAGRNNRGKITVRHQGGGTRPKYRRGNTGSSISSATRTVFRLRSRPSNTIRTEAQTSHFLYMQTAKRDTFLLLRVYRWDSRSYPDRKLTSLSETHFQSQTFRLVQSSTMLNSSLARAASLQDPQETAHSSWQKKEITHR